MHESEKWKWSHSVVSDLATPWTAAFQALASMGFSRQEYWSGVPLPSPMQPSLLSFYYPLIPGFPGMQPRVRTGHHASHLLSRQIHALSLFKTMFSVTLDLKVIKLIGNLVFKSLWTILRIWPSIILIHLFHEMILRLYIHCNIFLSYLYDFYQMFKWLLDVTFSEI